MSTYQVGQLESFFSKSCKGKSDLSAGSSNKFKQIYDSWMEKPFAKFEKPKNATSDLVFTKFVKKSKKMQSKESSEFSPENALSKSLKKAKNKTKNSKKLDGSVLDSTVDEQETPKFNKLSNSITPENDFPNLETSSKKKKKKRKLDDDQLNNSGESENAVEEIAKKKKKIQQDNSSTPLQIAMIDANDTQIAKTPLSKKALKFLKKMSKLNASDGRQDSEVKDGNKSLTSIDTVSEVNESGFIEDQQSFDEVNVNGPNETSVKRKKKKKNKRKSNESGDTNNLNYADSETKQQNQNDPEEAEAVGDEEQVSDTVSRMNVDTEQEGVRKRKRKNKKGKNTSFVSDLSQNASSINEELDDNDGSAEMEEPKKKKKKKEKNALAGGDEDNDLEMQLILAKKEAKLMKKRNKKLKGIVPGVDSEAELTKFSSKSEDADNESKQEDEDSGSEQEDNSFPRTPNGKQFVTKVDSEEKTNRTLFVGNLPTDTDKKTLTEIFKPYGKVESVRLRCAVPKKPSIPKKIANMTGEYSEEATSLKGFVVFTEQEDAEKALALNGTVFNGHHIRVDKAHGGNQQSRNNQNNVGGGNQQNRNNQNNSRPVYNDSLTAYVGNLPYNVEDETLWNTFGSCGTVKAVRVVRDRDSGQGKGFGFVEFQDSDTLEAALALSGTEVGGRPIRVNRCERNPQRNDNQQRSPKWQQNRGSGPPRRNFGFKKFGRNDQQDSGPRKTFKKFNEKRKRDDEKKKIADIFKTDKKSP